MAKERKQPKSSDGGEDKLRQKWLNRLQREEVAHKTFRDEAREAERTYEIEKSKVGATEAGTPSLVNQQIFPAFWSTVNVTHAALFSRLPRPDVRKRNVDVQAPIDRQIAMAIERALTFTMDTTEFDRDSHQAVDDFLVSALGTGKVEMKIETGEAPVINPETGMPVPGEDGLPMMQEVVLSRQLIFRHVYWSRFRWEPCPAWHQVSWVAYDHYLTREEFEEQFKIELPERPTGAVTTETEPGHSKLGADKYEQFYCVSEVWDRTKREVVFVSRDYPTVLRRTPDPLGLADFYPSPRPMFANLKRKEVVPKPDYTYIRSQLDLIDAYTRRIAALTREVKDVGFYDAGFQELAQLVNATDGTRVPVKGLIERLGASEARMNMDAVVVLQDNRPKMEVIAAIQQQLLDAKALLYETIGISDILRGQTNPNETATAQGIKNQWANVRLAPKLDQIAKFFRDVFRIMSEIMCERYEPYILQQMTGIEITPEMQQVMRDDFLRAYAIDVETDSTIAQDDVLEREQRAETAKVVGDMLQTLLPALMAGQIPAELAKQLMLFTIRSTKYGREFEDAINALPDNAQQLQQLTGQLQQMQQQLMAAQQQLEQVNASEEQRKDVKTQTDATEKVASAERQMAEAERIRREPVQPALVAVP